MSTASGTPPPPGGQFIVYQTEEGKLKIDVRFEGETVWLSLNQLAVLFQRDKSVISRHLKNIFDEGELVQSSVVAESATTAADGKIYQVEYFNLDAIISVGYRVKSAVATRFRIWATQRLREYDKFKSLASTEPRQVDTDFDQATKGLMKLPRPKKPKRPES
jgi:hypothetical protein